ncbi:RidA family protein [Dactylosporangium sp. CA-139066]|uniref:RidA family protein n=1 Tax=Dactylosporangium sp. CA-139066 TaxID=3239930 RepID=UPI003D8BF184
MNTASSLLSTLVTDGPPPVGGPRPAILPLRHDAGLVTVSGQTAVGSDGSLRHTGAVGDGALSLAQARDCAWQCALNVLAVLQRELGSLDRIEQVDRITVYVASVPGFTDQHLVADAATEAFLRVLGERGAHARTALGVAALPTGSPTEVDAIVRVRPE